jgi:hypothetical protein
MGEAAARAALDAMVAVLGQIDELGLLTLDERVQYTRELYTAAGHVSSRVDQREQWRELFVEPLLVRALEYARSPPPRGPDFTVELFALLNQPDPRCPCTDGERCREMTRGPPCVEHRRAIERRRAIVRAVEPALLTALPADVVRDVLARLANY